MSIHFSGYGRFFPSYGDRFRHQHSPHYHGFCRNCCHPMALCCCGFRECIKMPKEVIISPSGYYLQVQDPVKVLAEGGFVDMTLSSISASPSTSPDEEKKTTEGVTTKEATIDTAKIREAAAEIKKAGIFPPVDFNTPPNAIIGGGCCVHLSIEIIPHGTSWRNLYSGVSITVVDSDSTYLTWEKFLTYSNSTTDSNYYIKEGIITTKPGARLYGQVLYAIARVRWCEVFSC